MNAPSPAPPDFRLADQIIRPAINEIAGPSGVQKVNPKAMQVLLALASHPDQVCSRQQLLDAVWPDLHVNEEVLSTAVWELRRTLGDQARSPRFIQTVAKRGYRLLIQPEPVAAATPSGPPARNQGTDGSIPLRRLPGSLVWPILAVVLVAVLVTSGLLLRGLLPSAPPPVRSLAVLPILSLGDDPRDQALADGVTDTLTTALARLDGLRVVSRTTAFTYRKTSLTAPEIADKLGVDALVEGTMARASGRIVLNAQLIDARTEDHLWAETYERRFEDLLDLQVEIARSIGAAIAVRLEPEPSPPPANSASPLGASLLRWRFQTGGEIWSAPLVNGGSVLVGSRDGQLYSLSLADGSERWRLRVGDEVTARPLVLDGSVLAVAREGWVVAADVQSGGEQWRRHLESSCVSGLVGGAGVVVAADEGGLVSAFATSSGRRLWSWRGGDGVDGLAAGDGMIVVSRYDGSVSSLDAVDGTLRWTVPVAEWLELPCTVVDGTVLVPSHGGQVVALAAADGHELWRSPVVAPSEVTVWRDRVLVGGHGAAVTALDLTSGAELWQLEALDSVEQPLVVGETVLAGSRDHNLYAIDAWSGRLEWRVQQRTWLTSGAAGSAGADSGIVFGSLDGGVTCLAWPTAAEHPQVIAEEQSYRPSVTARDQRSRGYDLVLDDSTRDRPRLRWRFRTDGPVTLAAALNEDTVLVPGYRSLHQLDLGTGEERWSVRLAGETGTAPVIVHDTVVVGSREGTLAAFGLHTGEERWRVRTGAGIISTPVQKGDSLFFGSRDGFLYAVAAATGTERWRRQLDVIHASPTVAGEILLVPTRSDRLWALAPTDGSVLWSRPTADWAVADPVVWQDLVMVASCDGSVQAFSWHDGHERWRANSGGEIWFRPLVSQSRLFFGSADYHLYALDAATGRELWRHRTGNRVLTSAAGWHDLVMVGSHDRTLHAVEAATGNPVWRLRTTGTVGNPTVAGDLLVVGSHDEHVYCIDLDP